MGFDRSLLVTGAGGQLGIALARLVPGGTHLTRPQLDITDRRAVIDTFHRLRPSVIVNAAAYTDVDRAERDEETAFRINAEAVAYLAEAANDVGSLLVQISTDYVFQGNKDSPYSENDETGPLSVYGKSKLEGERLAITSRDHLVVRTSWVFGEGRNFIRSIYRASQNRDELQVVDDQIGRPTYALDLAEGILGLVSARARGVYHLAGTGEPGSWADLAEIALHAIGSSTKVRRISTSEYYSGHPGPVAPRPMRSVLDCERAAGLGIKLRAWREAIAAYVKETQ